VRPPPERRQNTAATSPEDRISMFRIPQFKKAPAAFPTFQMPFCYLYAFICALMMF